jgi:glycosyltransferase XagB
LHSSDGHPKEGRESARDGASALQTWGGLALLTAIIAVQVSWPDQSILVLLMAPVFLAFIVMQVGAALEESAHGVTPIPELPEWPFYSVLVPLYREARVVPQLMQAMAAMEYPADRLEILLLVESDDHATLQALAQERAAPHFRLALVPPGLPRTKPRALNYGLTRAQGELITVYDAEDIPEPDQLKRAAGLFHQLPPEFVCLQARLVIDNGADSWFARMASIEYAALFDAIKCGLAADDLPVPLGGTSNHFRRSALDALGGWDAWNVTEDADLGYRIARAGWRVGDLASATFEEAPVTFRAWLGQRRRWFKGWMQTLVTHGRNPRSAIRAGGPWNWLMTMVQLMGVVGGGLLFPILIAHFIWLAWSGWLFQRDSFVTMMANSVAIATIGAGAFAMLVPTAIGLKRRGALHLLPWALTLPAYLLLISLACWMALVDLMLRPFHWEKTEHGIGKRRRNTL